MVAPQTPIYDIEPVATGFALRRDGAPMKTPAGQPLCAPTQKLAKALAAEWSGCGPKDGPEKRPLNQLAATAIDIVAKKKEGIAAAVAASAGTDLLCHREEEPAELASKQKALWQPWLDWAQKCHGVELQVTVGSMPATQPEKSLTALRHAVAALDPFWLTGLQQAASVSGSLILGLALMEGVANAEQLFDAAELEALYQMKKWGEDPVTIERHASVKSDLELCQNWFRALKKDWP